MRILFYIVLLGALVLANVSGEVDSTRESLERSTFDDQSQTDDNEKVIHTQSLATIESFLRSPVNLSKDTGRINLLPIDSGGHISDANEGNKDSNNSEEVLDLSSEGNPPQLETHVAATVNQSVTVDPAAQVVVNTTSEEIKTLVPISAQGQRTIATNKLLQNRLDRSKTTTTANPISGHSDEESDDSDKKTTTPTTARSSPTKNRFGGLRTTTARSLATKESSEQDDSVKTIQTTVKPIQSTTTIRNPISGKFGRFRTPTASVPVSNNSDEEIGLTKQIVTTTARSFTTNNRFSRVRTTTVSTPDASAEEIKSVNEVKTTTAASLTFGNRFGRLHTTTLAAKDSDEEVDAVKEIQTTTVRPSLPKTRLNRFKTTAIPKPVRQESKEQGNVTTSTPVPHKLLIGNKFNRIRTASAAVPISDTSDEIANSVKVTQTTTSRSVTSTNRLSRFRTTSASASKKDSEEQDDVINVTTTTLRTPSFRNMFSRTRTTTSSPISRDSIEEEDVNQTSTTTIRSLPTRKMFGLPRTITVPARIPNGSDEDGDVVNKTETSTTRRFLAGNRFGRIQTTTLPSIKTTSQNSDEEVDDATQTTTARSLATTNRFKGFRVTTPASRDSEERVSPVNNTQTNARNLLLRNRVSRLQTTTTTSLPEHSDEQVDSGNGTQTTPASVHIELAHINSNEQDDTNNSTETTTVRNQVALKYSHRYRTTTVLNLTLENSDEQEDDLNSTTPMTSSIQIPSTTKSPPLTPASTIVAEKATLSSEIANLERKDRAIIYNAQTNVIVNHPSKFETTTTRLPIFKSYFTTLHSDEMDDVSEDDDISSILYSYIEYRTPVAPTTTRVMDEDNSAEIDDFSLESKDSVTEKPEHSAETADNDRVTIVGPEVLSAGKTNDDVSMEFIIVVNSNSKSARNKTAAFLQGAKLLMDSDEGNDVSAEGEASGDVPNEDDQYQTTPVQKFTHVESEEGNDASTEAEISRDIANRTSSVEPSVVESEERSNVSTDTEASDGVYGEKMNIEHQTESVEQDVNLATESDEGNNVSAEMTKSALSGNREDRNKTSTQLPQDSDEKDESSLEVDVSKLPEIKRLLTDVENGESSTEAVDKTAAVQTENRVLFPDIEQLFKLDVENQTATPTKSTNQTLMEEANKKKEVTMKIRELLTNPIVQERLQERLQAIDGRLKDSKSARVKRLIEKYLAALAKLSPSSNSATSFSFSVLLPFMVTCLLLGFS
ncbi:mucin-2-like [Daphnia carinata]|uniref:mucin-2-like n=1 Tax=Daphnia carinata TaxID=120202 RepID=UPI00257A800E|nr:mucin-2-like [Daphnia carinata]